MAKGVLALLKEGYGRGAAVGQAEPQMKVPDDKARADAQTKPPQAAQDTQTQEFIKMMDKMDLLIKDYHN